MIVKIQRPLSTTGDVRYLVYDQPRTSILLLPPTAEMVEALSDRSNGKGYFEVNWTYSDSGPLSLTIVEQVVDQDW